jgi:hypothetical protein
MVLSHGGHKRLWIHGERVPNKGLWALTAFIVVLNSNLDWYHSDDTWKFPDVEKPIPDFPGCDCNEEYPNVDLTLVIVINEYDDLTEELG